MMSWVDERREHPRVALQWPAVIRKLGDGRTIRAKTLNLSCGGVCCLSGEPFQPGERLEMVLFFPDELEPKGRVLRLHCLVSVVRSEPDGASYRVACRMEDYNVVVGANGRWFDQVEIQPESPERTEAGAVR